MKTKTQAGMTLIELMTVLAIIASVSVLAIPNFISWLPDHRLRKAARDLHANFQVAKLTAVKTNACCTMVFGQKIGGIDYDYVLFEDADNDLEYDAAEKIIDKVSWSDYKNVRRNTSRKNGGITFSKNDEGVCAVSFRPNGLPIDNGGNTGAGTVFLVNSFDHTKKVVLSSAGSVRIAN